MTHVFRTILSNLLMPSLRVEAEVDKEGPAYKGLKETGRLPRLEKFVEFLNKNFASITEALEGLEKLDDSHVFNFKIELGPSKYDEGFVLSGDRFPWRDFDLKIAEGAEAEITEKLWELVNEQPELKRWLEEYEEEEGSLETEEARVHAVLSLLWTHARAARFFLQMVSLIGGAARLDFSRGMSKGRMDTSIKEALKKGLGKKG